MMKFSEQIKLIRKSEGYTQQAFSDLLKKNVRTIQKYENNESESNGEFMKKVCEQFPEYTVWLMTGETKTPKQTKPNKKTKK